MRTFNHGKAQNLTLRSDTPGITRYLTMKVLRGLIVILLIGAASVQGQDVILEGVALSDWGVWGEMEVCPVGTYVYGMRLKVHPDQGIFEDDTALNGIELLCISPAAQRSTNQFSVIHSTIGHKGDFGQFIECAEPYFASGFQLRSERPDAIGPLGDDTAGNNLRLMCNDANSTMMEGYGTQWGDWTMGLRCPRGLRICSIQTRVEGPNGDDDTTLNSVNMGCCT